VIVIASHGRVRRFSHPLNPAPLELAIHNFRA